MRCGKWTNSGSGIRSTTRAVAPAANRPSPENKSSCLNSRGLEGAFDCNAPPWDAFPRPASGPMRIRCSPRNGNTRMARGALTPKIREGTYNFGTNQALRAAARSRAARKRARRRCTVCYRFVPLRHGCPSCVRSRPGFTLSIRSRNHEREASQRRPLPLPCVPCAGGQPRP